MVIRGGKAGQPAPQSYCGLEFPTRPAKLLRVRIPDPPRRFAGQPAVFFFKIKYYFFYILFLKNCQIKPIYLLLSNPIFFSSFSNIVKHKKIKH